MAGREKQSSDEDLYNVQGISDSFWVKPVIMA